VKERNHTIEISGTTVIDNRHATKIQTIIASDSTNRFLFAEHGYPCNALTGCFGGGDHCAWIIPFGQDDVLRP
jgi:hypothetical protein